MSQPTRTRSKARPAQVEQFDLEQDARALQGAVADLVRVYQFRDRDKICCYDVSVTQCHAIETLVRKGPMQLNALAAFLYLDKSTASRVIDSLERKGYVERMPSVEDRRAVTLRVTRPGKALCERIQADIIEQQTALIRDLDPQLRATVTDVIERLARAAEARFRSGVSCDTEQGACAPGGACA